MSCAALGWAFDQDLPGAHKFVLVALADQADHENVCFPSQKLIAFRCGIARTRVITLVAELEEWGYLTVIPRKRANGSDTSNSYQLNLPDTPSVMKEVKDTVMGCVYVVSSADVIKIGVTRDMESRLKALKSMSPVDVQVVETFEMSMPRARKIERMAHESLNDVRLKGEWFRTTPQHGITIVKKLVEDVPEMPLGGVMPVDTPVSTGKTPGSHAGRHPEPSVKTTTSSEDDVVPTTPKKEKPTRKTQIGTFRPDASARARAMAYWQDRQRPDLVPLMDDIVNTFVLYHRKEGKRMADWDAAWTTWYMNQLQHIKPPPPPRQPFNGGRVPPSSAYEQPTAHGFKDVNEATWVQRMEVFHGMNGGKKGLWNPAGWGPEPGKPGCIVPQKVLLKFGHSQRGAA